MKRVPRIVVRVARIARLARTARTAAMLTFAAAVLTLVPWMLWQRFDPAPERSTTGGALTVERLRSLSELTTLTVETVDVQVTRLSGRTGGTKAVLIVRGAVSVGVDLSRARFVTVDPATRRAVLLLPAPTVHSVRLDHEGTRLVGLWDSGLWLITPGGNGADAALVNRAYRDAQRLLAEAAREPARLEQSKAQAERVLRSFLDALEWRVDVRWAE